MSFLNRLAARALPTGRVLRPKSLTSRPRLARMEEEEDVQPLRRMEEEDAQPLRRMEEDEETVQPLRRQEEEEEVQATPTRSRMTPVQRMEETEEEAQPLRRMEEEEEVQPLHRMEAEDEEAAAQPLRRMEEEEEAVQPLHRMEEEEETAQPLRRMEEEEDVQPLRRMEEEEGVQPLRREEAEPETLKPENSTVPQEMEGEVEPSAVQAIHRDIAAPPVAAPEVPGISQVDLPALSDPAPPAFDAPPIETQSFERPSVQIDQIDVVINEPASTQRVRPQNRSRDLRARYLRRL